jgi:hypothetical protein
MSSIAAFTAPEELSIIPAAAVNININTSIPTKASNRLADKPINRLFTCRATLFSVIG